MNIFLNGEATELACDGGRITLNAALIAWGYLQEDGQTPKGQFVVALEGKIVPQQRFADTELVADNKVDVLGAITGG